MRNVKMFLTLSRIARPVGFRPDAVKPGFHRARTQWIRGFMAFKLPRRTRTVILMVLA
jgi:hypothetical protein